MKRIIITALLLCGALASNAQTGTAKIEQYCQVIITPQLLSNKVSIDIDFGEEKKYLKDTRLRTDEFKIKKFNTIIDAMNYMGQAGWIFINAFSVKRGETEIYHFAFKKEFLKTEPLSRPTD